MSGKTLVTANCTEREVHRTHSDEKQGGKKYKPKMGVGNYSDHCRVVSCHG